MWLFGLFLGALPGAMLPLEAEAKSIAEKTELLLEIHQLPARPVYLLVQWLVQHSGLMLAAVPTEIMLGKQELEDLLSAERKSRL